MRHHFIAAIRYTLVTTIIFGVCYPYLITGLAHLIFPLKANGQLLQRGDQIIGSSIIGQPFSGPQYFHGRLSAAGSGYDAGNSSGSNLAATNRKLIDRVAGNVQMLQFEHPGVPVPIDLVTSSASGLDPDITPAAAEWQVERVSKARGVSVQQIRTLVQKHTSGRQFGVFGEPRVNVLELNLDLH